VVRRPNDEIAMVVPNLSWEVMNSTCPGRVRVNEVLSRSCNLASAALLSLQNADIML